MNARRAIFEPMNMKKAPTEIDLIPSQRAEFRSPEPVPKCEQDRRLIPVAVATTLSGGRHQPLDLFRCEVFTASIRLVSKSAPTNCCLYSRWSRIVSIIESLVFPNAGFHDCPQKKH